MCGGIVGALSFSLPETVRNNRWKLLPYLLAYNSGRIFSYALAGALIALLGRTLFETISPQFGHTLLQWFAAITMIGLGLYIAGWFPAMAQIERLGRPIWQKIEPYGQRLLPVKSPWQALLFGLIWGWLPCGLVYTALFYSASAGSAENGALFMLAFGLGTLPAVFTAGVLSSWMVNFARRPHVRRIMGLLIILFGIITLVVGSQLQHEDHLFHLHM